jgi:hypothetical protein
MTDQVVTWDEVRRMALALPQTEEGTSFGNMAWKVNGKAFVWERPLRRSDHAVLGAAAPPGPILGVRIENVLAKDALLAEGSDGIFTIPHFDGYAAVLVQLDRVDLDKLTELVEEAWLACAPRRLAKTYLQSR